MSDQGSGGGTKEIKFSFVVDQASAQSVMKTLKDLTDQAEKFAKALQGAAGAMNGGGSFFGGGTAGGKAAGPASTITKAAGRAGAGGGGSAITNVVMENAKAFKSMASMSGDALKSMQDILKKSVDDQKRSIGDLDKTIANLGKSYQQLKKDQQEAVGMAQKLGINPALLKSQISQKMSETGAELAAKQGEKLKATADLSAMSGAPKGFGAVGAAFQQGGGGLGGMWGAMNANMGGPGLASILGPLGMGGLVKAMGPMALMALGKEAFQETRTNSRMMTDSMAERGRVLNPTINQLRSGDTSFMAKLNFMNKDQTLRSELEGQWKGMGANIEAFSDSSGSLWDKVARAAVGGVDKITGADGLDPKLQTQLIKSYIEHANKAGDMVEFQQRYGAWNAYQDQSSGTRRAFQMAGGEGRGFRQATMRDAQGRAIGSSSATKFYDDYLDKEMDLTRRGFSMQELHGARMQMLGSAGEGGRRFGEQAMSAAAGGYGAYNSILAQSIRMGRGDELSKMAIGGKIDKHAGFQLGAGVMGMNQFGLTDSAGIFAAAQNSGAFGQGTDFIQTNRMLAGLQAGNAFINSSPYQQGANLLGAIDTLQGRGLGYKSEDYLAGGMSFADMINVAGTGKMTEKGKMLGLNADDVKKQLNTSLMAGMDLSFDEKSNDPMSKALAKFRKSKEFEKGDVTGYAKKLMASGNREEGRALLMNGMDALGIGEGESLGLIDVLMGHSTGKGAGKGGVGAGKLTGVEADEAEAKAVQLKRIRDMDEEMFKQKRAELQNAEQMANTLQNFGQNMGDSAERLTGSLTRLDEAVNLAAQNMTKLMDPKDAAKFNRPAIVKSPNQSVAAPATSQSSAPMSSQPVSSGGKNFSGG